MFKAGEMQGQVEHDPFGLFFVELPGGPVPRPCWVEAAYPGPGPGPPAELSSIWAALPS